MYFGHHSVCYFYLLVKLSSVCLFSRYLSMVLEQLNYDRHFSLHIARTNSIYDVWWYDVKTADLCLHHQLLVPFALTKRNWVFGRIKIGTFWEQVVFRPSIDTVDIRLRGYAARYWQRKQQPPVQPPWRPLIGFGAWVDSDLRWNHFGLLNLVKGFWLLDFPIRFFLHLLLHSVSDIPA